MAALPPTPCMVVVSYQNSSIPIPIFHDTPFSTLVDRILVKWPMLSKDSTSFKYRVGALENCFIDMECDYISMLYLIKSLSAQIVHMDVIYNPKKPRPSPVSDNFVNPNFSHNSSSSEAYSQIDDEDEPTPTFAVCPPLKPKPLLSDSWVVSITGVGQRFLGGIPEFRQELVKYSSKCSFRYKFVKNNKTKVRVVCALKDEEKCDWFISGKIDVSDNAFVISRCYLVHCCGDNLVNDSSQKLNPKIISSFIEENVRLDPTFRAKDVKTMFNSSYAVDMCYSKCWRTLSAAREKIFGSYNESYDQLRWYALACVRTNPGTKVHVESYDDTQKFRRFYVAYKPCIDGFKHCRPILFVDATALKGRFKGQLLVAVAKDGNNSLFPVALAVVDAETIDNWTFFLKKLRDTLVHDDKIYYVSDRNVGLLRAFEDLYKDDPVNFFCLYHLYTNLKGYYNNGSWTMEFRKKMVGSLKRCAYAPTKAIFKEELEAFYESGGPLARDFIKNLPFEKWAVSYSAKSVRYGEMTSNAAESFNNWVKNSKGLPITYMIDSIRRSIMEWFVERRSASNKWTGALCKRKEKFWSCARQAGNSWQINRAAAEGEYEVIAEPTVSVSLIKRTCSCYQWQVLGFPCVHAVNVIQKHCPKISGVVDPYFFADMFRKAYSSDIHPIPTSMRSECERLVPNEHILPPDVRIQPGRPKRKRIPSFGEFPGVKVRSSRCSICKQDGFHDAVTCPMNNPISNLNRVEE